MKDFLRAHGWEIARLTFEHLWLTGFALLLAVITGLLCGLAPAFAALRTSVNDTLKEGGRSGSAGGRHARLRSALVVSEIAVALVLLAASGLLLLFLMRRPGAAPAKAAEGHAAVMD